MVFLPEDHPYKIATFDFNGTLERTQRPEIMTLLDWNRAYDRKKEKEMA
jgi:hypothetical protein